jgi:hypothetical protein
MTSLEERFLSGPPPNLTLLKKPIKETSLAMQGPQPSSSFIVPGITEGINYTNDGDIGTRIQE